VRNAVLPGLPAPSGAGGATAGGGGGSSANGEADGLENVGRGAGEDILLKEAEHILADYVGLLERSPAQRAMK